MIPAVTVLARHQRGITGCLPNTSGTLDILRYNDYEF
jgi:hypothetical protein